MGMPAKRQPSKNLRVSFHDRRGPAGLERHRCDSRIKMAPVKIDGDNGRPHDVYTEIH